MATSKFSTDEENVFQKGWKSTKGFVENGSVSAVNWLDNAQASISDNARKNPDDWGAKIGGILLPLFTSFAKAGMSFFGMLPSFGEKGVELVSGVWNGGKNPQTQTVALAPSAPEPQQPSTPTMQVSPPAGLPDVRVKEEISRP